MTAQERDELRTRRERFDTFLAERMPVLADFAESLELANPTRIVADPDRYLPSVGEFMRHQDVGADDRVWIITRLGYLIGEVLVQRLGGCWFINEIPDSRYFLRYVVGRFTRIGNHNAMVDPFEIASAFVDQPPSRELLVLVLEVERALRAA